MVQRQTDAAADGLVTVTEQMQLQVLGFRVEHISPSTVRMTSQNWLSVVQQDQVTVVTTQGQELRSLQLPGLKSAQISPFRDVIALSTDEKIFAICLQTNQMIRWNRFPCDVVYWSWVSRSIIGLVGRECIYHWLIDSDSLSFVTSISPRLRNTHFTGYQVDRYHGWHVLQTKLSDASSPVTGLTQVHSTAHSHCTVFESEATAVTAYKFPSNSYTSQVLVAVSKTTSTSAKISVVELGPQKPDRNLLINRCESFHWSDANDVAAHIICNPDSGLIHILSEKGLLFVFGFDTCCPYVLNKRVSCHPIFDAVAEKETGGLMVFISGGQVLSISVQHQNEDNETDNQPDRKKGRIPEQVTRL